MEGANSKKCCVCHREAKDYTKMLVSSRFVCEGCLTVLAKNQILCCVDCETALEPSSKNTEGVFDCLCQDTYALGGVGQPFFEGEGSDRFLNLPAQIREQKRPNERRYYSGKCFASESNPPRLIQAVNSTSIDAPTKKVQELTGQTTKPREKCEKHDMEEKKFYCQTCKKNICRDCAILDHRDHEFVYYKEHVELKESHHERLRRLLEFAEEKQAVLNEKLQNLDSRLERKSKEIEEVKMKMKSKTMRVKELLSEQEEMFLSCLDGHIQSFTANVQSQKSTLQSALDDVNHGLELAQEMFKKNGQRLTRKCPNGMTNLRQETPDELKLNVGPKSASIETGNHGNQVEFESEADFCDDELSDAGEDSGSVEENNEWKSKLQSLKKASIIEENNKVPLPNNPTFHAVKVLGGQGTGSGQFQEPVGVTISSDGTIFVADYNNDRLQVFDKNGEYLRSITHVTTDTGRKVGFLCPTGLATDKSGNIVVAERGRHRITIITPEGHLQRKFGKLGKARGQFRDPHGVSVDKRGRIIVADTTNNRIQVFDKNGDVIFTFGHKGEHVLDYPNYAVFHKGLFFVSDTDNDAVKIFDKEGQYVRTLGDEEKEGHPFGAPSGLAVYKDDYILVCDFNNDCVKMFSLKGEFVSKIGHEGNGPGEFSGPEAVVVTPDDNIIVTDKNNSRAQVFELNMDSESACESIY